MDGVGGCQIAYGGTGSLHVDLQAPTGTPLCKNKEGKGSARAWPVAAPMPKSDSFSREKREMLNDGRWSTIFLLTFFHGDGYLFITYIVPNLRAAGILSYWIKYFLPLSNEILKGSGYQRLSPFLFDET